MAEQDYGENLKEHYEIVKEELTKEHDEILALEQALLRRASEEMAESHRRLRDVTDQNLLREKHKIDEGKKRKIEALKNPLGEEEEEEERREEGRTKGKPKDETKPNPGTETGRTVIPPHKLIQTLTNHHTHTPLVITKIIYLIINIC